ncbi:MAG: polysaccharide lyase family protein [Limisphaerales bacterium]
MNLGRAGTLALTSWLLVSLVLGRSYPRSALAREADTARRLGPPVTVVEDAGGFTLANGSVTAHIEKRSGTFSLKYKGVDLIDRGYWSQVGRSSVGSIARFGSERSSALRIDPARNGGERAEVSCRFGYDGKSDGLPCDVDLRFALARGDHGLYTYAVWEHKPGYPGFSVGEARTAYKLNPRLFDFLAIDARRLVRMPSPYDWDHGDALNMKEVRRMTTGADIGRVEHKYDYSAILADTPAYGWASRTQHLGIWLINPSIEYLAGGPTKVELTGHLDVNPGGAPTLLNMWHGSHYGGSSLVVGEQESWNKFIGPFLLYCNSGSDPGAMWQEAVAHAKTEQHEWPYGWVSDPNYPLSAHRSTVTGSIVVSDPTAPRLAVRDLQVGLAPTPYTPPGPRSTPVDWQRDSKHYQFWSRANGKGKFAIHNIRPGTYTLYAFADGVLGEFSLANITVAAGQTKDVGHLKWTPVRYGRQLWEIGISDRSAAEFRHGDHYWRWGLYYEYPKEFPNDVNFVIGKSDWRRDWNYCQPPRIEGNRVESTAWSVTFGLAETLRGNATLRLAIAGSRAPRGIEVNVNGASVGGTGPLPDTGVMHRDGIRGYWCERDVSFDAALLKPGPNVIKLQVPASSWVNGVLYDYLRLEVEPGSSKSNPGIH